MFKYYNANPLNRKVDDCTVRAISKATNRSWDETYLELCHYAREQGIMPNEVQYIDEYLEKRFKKLCDKCQVTVEDFVYSHPKGIYLLTMRGHITCCIDGVIYDTFYPGERFVWGAYKVK